MLSERITALFKLLQCNNTDIARYAGCSPGNISKLKTGNRAPQPSSRSVRTFVRGVYAYADYENLLPVLAELCHAPDTGRSSLIPALIAWLYEAEAVSLPANSATPKSKQAKARQRQSFGKKLDRAMTLLELSNGQLAALLNIDASLVSRYRSGVYSPQGNEQLSEALSGLLLARAKKNGQLAAFAAMCGTTEAGFGIDAITAWLYSTAAEADNVAIARRLLHSLDDFIPGPGRFPAASDLPAPREEARYWGTPGLRDAVVRFLTNAAREGGEMLLYSDEPMDWMSGDREFFGRWAALMAACVQKGVRIRIIHNMDRDGMEMVSAITGWFPLYISGMIEPFVFQKARNARFYHTVFLRPGHEAILGFFPTPAGEGRWYDYITAEKQLDSLQSGFLAMLSEASAFLKIYPAWAADTFWERYRSHTGRAYAVLRGLSIASMPDGLLERMLARAKVGPDQRQRVVAFHRASRKHFLEILQNGDLHEVLRLPEPAAVESGSVPVNLEVETEGLRLTYTPQEYAEHLAAVAELVEREKNYHLTLLPQSPFQELQVFTMKNAVGVIHCREPYTTFVFLNATLMQSVYDYCDFLAAQHTADRRTIRETLMQLSCCSRNDIPQT